MPGEFEDNSALLVLRNFQCLFSLHIHFYVWHKLEGCLWGTGAVMLQNNMPNQSDSLLPVTIVTPCFNHVSSSATSSSSVYHLISITSVLGYLSILVLMPRCTLESPGELSVRRVPETNPTDYSPVSGFRVQRAWASAF